MSVARRPVLAAAVLLVGCGLSPSPEPTPEPPAPSPPAAAATAAPAAVDLVDETYPAGTAGEPGWEYAATVEADLDGDGARETVTLVANVGLYRGEPMWDDGQVWQAYVVAPGGERTEIYRRYVQLGDVALGLAEPAGQGPRPTVLLTETTPHGLRVVEVDYRGVGDVHAVVAFERLLRSGPEPLRVPG